MAAKPGPGPGPVKSTATQMTTEEAAQRRANAPKAKVITDKSFLSEALTAHNRYRTRHKADKLVLDDELCQVAQAYAAKLAKSGEAFQYSGSGYGESIFFTTEGPVSGSAAADAWYTESRRYDWNNIDKQKGTSHFTQMIWKSTQKLGIAMATSKIGIYVVANYFPPGNVTGQYKLNVSAQDKTK